MIILLKGNCPISLRKKICFGLILREKGVCPKMTNCSNKGGGKANSFAVSDAFPFLPPPTELLLLLSHHRRRTAKNTTKFPLQNSKRIFLFIFEAMESAQTEIVWHAQPFRTEKILFSSNVMGVGKREHLPFLVFPFLFLFFRQIVLLRVHGWLQSCGAIFRWLKEKEEEEVLSPLSFLSQIFLADKLSEMLCVLNRRAAVTNGMGKRDSFCGFFWVGRSVRLAATRQQQLSFYLLFLFHLGVIQSRLSV